MKTHRAKVMRRRKLGGRPLQAEDAGGCWKPEAGMEAWADSPLQPWRHQPCGLLDPRRPAPGL